MHVRVVNVSHSQKLDTSCLIGLYLKANLTSILILLSGLSVLTSILYDTEIAQQKYRLHVLSAGIIGPYA